MTTACHITKRRKRGKTVFKNVTSDAAILGVNVRTLQRVLAGEWKLPGLDRRYKRLKAAQLEAAK